MVAKAEFHFGELFPRVGFIVTNLATSSRTVVRFYNKRGTLVADQLAAAAAENRRTIDQHGRYYWLLLAESHLTRRLFGGMLRSRRCRRRPDTAACRAQQISATG